MNKTLLLLVTLHLGVWATASQALALKSVLSPNHYQALLKQWPADAKAVRIEKSENYFLDTDDFLLRHNGILLRLQLSEGQAKILLRDFGRYSADPFSFEAGIEEDASISLDKSRGKTMECQFSDLKRAHSLITNASEVFALTDGNCQATTEVLRRLMVSSPSRKLKLPQVGKISNRKAAEQSQVVIAQLRYEDLRVQASYREIRHLFQSPMVGLHLPIVLSERHYGQEGISYQAEIQTQSVINSQVLDWVSQAFSKQLAAVGQEWIKPLGGDNTAAFMIARQSTGLQWMFARGEIASSQKRPASLPY